MNKPCRIHFHDDAAPTLSQLPERYRANIETSGGGVVHSLLVQNAFYVDYTHGMVVRTRLVSRHTDDPIDFPLASVSLVEWFYGEDVPAPLKPEPSTKRNGN